MWETIVQVGGEGGGITLKGMKLEDGTWLFTRVRDESTLTEFIDGEDLETLRPLLKGQSKVVVGFEEGIQLLNNAWPHLYPKAVHPEFAEAVWNVVSNSDIRSLPFNHQVTTEDELRELMGSPSELVRHKVIDHLDEHCRHFIGLSPCLLMSTADVHGECDVSPRGDAPGFVQIIDEKRIVIPERPGNRRMDSLRNILSNPHIGLYF